MTREWEAGGRASFCGPKCRCLSRNQKKIGTATWSCRSCGRVNLYRFTADGYLPFSKEVALAMDEARHG